MPKSSLIRFSLILILILLLVVKVKFDYIQFDFNSWLAFQYQHLFGYYLILRVRIVWDLWRSWYAKGITVCRKQAETGRQYFCNITSIFAKAFRSFYSMPSLVHFLWDLRFIMESCILFVRDPPFKFPSLLLQRQVAT